MISDRSASPLAVTPTLPPVGGQDMQGVNRRLALFVEALADPGGPPVRLLRIVPAPLLDLWAGRGAELNRLESGFWGREVEIVLAPRRTRTETFLRHYVQGAWTAARQPDLFPFGSAEAAAEVARQLDRPTSAVLAHRLPGAMALLASGRGHDRLFFDLDDVEHRMRLRAAAQPPFRPGKLGYALHVPAVLLTERRAARAARATFVCSERDRAHLARVAFPRVAVAANAVEPPGAAPPLPPEPTILFLGLMSYAPNVEAAERLAQRIMPLVWRSAPAARLLIAGRGSEDLAGMADASIERLGFVADLDALYARTRIVCCPLTNGGGTRVKLIEAAGYAKPMVATRCGAEGLAFVDGESILIRDGDAAIAEACVRLLVDDAACRSIGGAAERLMRATYAKSEIVEGIRRVMRLAG